MLRYITDKDIGPCIKSIRFVFLCIYLKDFSIIRVNINSEVGYIEGTEIVDIATIKVYLS